MFKNIRFRKPGFRFLKADKLPGFQNSDNPGRVPGFKTGYSGRIRIANFGKPGTRYPVFFFFKYKKRKSKTLNQFFLLAYFFLLLSAAPSIFLNFHSFSSIFNFTHFPPNHNTQSNQNQKP